MTLLERLYALYANDNDHSIFSHFDAFVLGEIEQSDNNGGFTSNDLKMIDYLADKYLSSVNVF